MRDPLRVGRTCSDTQPNYALTWHALDQMVARWAGRPMLGRPRATETEWEVQLPHGRVNFVPDNVEQLDDGILNEDFAPEPGDRICTRCPHYFICPVAES